MPKPFAHWTRPIRWRDALAQQPTARAGARSVCRLRRGDSGAVWNLWWDQQAPPNLWSPRRNLWNSLRSLGSTSTPFVTASSTMLSIKESPRPSRIPRPSPRPSVLPRLRESPLSDSSREFRTPSTTFTTSPESDDQKAVRKYLRPKRRITFVGINPSGSKFVFNPSCHGQFLWIFALKILDI
jgi:hypothetical protein